MDLVLEEDAPRVEPLVDPASFRDPSGTVYHFGERVIRTLSADAASTLRSVTQAGILEEWMGHGWLVRTRFLPSSEWPSRLPDAPAAVLEHSRIPFISYPYEWSFDMLRDAAMLTLDLLRRAVERGYILKDATPFNIQFDGPRPVFIDVTSLVPLYPGSPWTGYAQFCRTFLYPLMINSHARVDFQGLLRSSPEGLSPDDTARFLGWARWIRRGVPTHVLLQGRLEKQFGGLRNNGLRPPEFAFAPKHILSLIDRLRTLMESLSYRPDSAWLDYTRMDQRDMEWVKQKMSFISDRLKALRPALVLDLGCNTGEFSHAAAEVSKRVMAVDSDSACVNAVYLKAKEGRLPSTVQVAVIDLANPSPALGWGLRERRSWPERARGDFFLALALVHHLGLSRGIPADRIVDGLRETAPEGIVEFVAPDDPLAAALRIDTVPGYRRPAFEAALHRAFRVTPGPCNKAGTRSLYHCGAP